MTLIKIDLRRPNGEGLGTVTGYLRFTPTHRRTGTGYIVLPVPFDIPIIDGLGEVEVEPSGPGWYWRVVERVPAGTTRHIAVPNLPEVDYSALVDIDTASLPPATEPDPAWFAYVDGLNQQVQALSRDSGDLDGLPYLTGATGVLRFQRIGNTVTFTAVDLDTTNLTGTVPLPSGYRPTENGALIFRQPSAGDATITVNELGELTATKTKWNGHYHGTYQTTNPWSN